MAKKMTSLERDRAMDARARKAGRAASKLPGLRKSDQKWFTSKSTGTVDIFSGLKSLSRGRDQWSYTKSTTRKKAKAIKRRYR